ncbi:MAG: hypothetical protein IPH16_15335 [Haliscomenobacter sp.]|nr:hypothetical protein [Haliscomenobacter sp.]
MTKDADTYFSEGCGRCSLGGTPECKVLAADFEGKGDAGLGSVPASMALFFCVNLPV